MARKIIAPASAAIRRSWVGRQIGERTIVAVLGLTRRGHTGRGRSNVSRMFLIKVQCSCGRVDCLEVNTPSASKVKPRCVDCGRLSHSRRSTDPTVVQSAGDRDAFCDAVAASGIDLRDDSAEARIVDLIIARTLGPPKLSEAGRILGLSRERVRQIEAEALEKLRTELARAERRAAMRRAG